MNYGEMSLPDLKSEVGVRKAKIRQNFVEIESNLLNELDSVRKHGEDLVIDVKEFFDVGARVRRRPWQFMMASFVVGAVLGYRSTSRRSSDATGEKFEGLDSSNRPRPVAKSIMRNFREKYPEEIEQVRSVAMGAVIATLGSIASRQLSPAISNQFLSFLKKKLL